MEPKNTSDSIEEYIKELLTQSGVTELKRSHLAAYFQVVPSQINYVIKTRFTESRGYVVESKRGGGGYIRIAKVDFSDRHQELNHIICHIGDSISATVFADLVQLLFEQGILTEREVQLLVVSSSDEVLGIDGASIRARMLRKILQRLDRKRFDQ